MFASAVAWPASSVGAVPTNGAGHYCYCPPATRIDNINTAGCVGRLFTGRTVRGLLYDPLTSTTVNVLEDRRYFYSGSENGGRRVKKFWNGMGKGTKGAGLRRVKYEFDVSRDKYSMELADGSGSQHIYVVDVFQSGMDGLDLVIPTVSDVTNHLSADRQSGTSKGRDSMVPQPPSKRAKTGSSSSGELSDDFVKMEVDDSGDPVDAMKNAEDVDGVDVRIITEMKLYWFYPKK